MTHSILIVDDEESIRNSLGAVLSDEGYRVICAKSGKECLERLSTLNPDVILLDIWMPEIDGLETLESMRQNSPDQIVIMMSGHGSIESAVRATKLGAYDFIEKPLSLEKLLVVVKNACRAKELTQENKSLRKQIQKQKTLIGQSPTIQSLKDVIRKVAPTTGSVLITGENGTGKELVAHSLHALSPRFSKPFIEVNCAAIPEDLIEDELFGHEKGAFTGATSQRRGKFDQAHEGTLFLDEIADMSLKTQAKILRILQEQKFERVGGTETINVDVRIVAATNKDLKIEIQRGNFREDLFYRLNVIPFHVPPLRQRVEDILPLAEHFLSLFAAANHKPHRSLSENALSALQEYHWPGNVRELKNLLERIVILSHEDQESQPILAAEVLSHLEHQDGLPTLDSFPSGASVNPSTRNLRDARQEFEKDFILNTLRENGGNISKTAAVLGIERSHLHRKIKSFGIEL